MKLKIRTFFLGNLPLISFLFSLSILVILFAPLLSPILDARLEFIYGDFSAIININSSMDRYQVTYYTFNQHLGALTLDVNRAFLLESISILANLIHITDSQIHSVIILISLILGSYGIYKLTTLFIKNKKYQALLIPTLTIFYYLNLWSAERLGHIWIWDAYAIFPLYLYLGLAYISNEKTKFLLTYSLLYAIYGMIPHNFLYMLFIHLSLVIFSIIKPPRKIKTTFLLATVPLVIYTLLNMPVLLIAFIVKGATYPIQITMDQLSMLSRNGTLLNIFTFSNNWWPQVPTSTLNNPLFRATSILIFILTFSTIMFIKKEDKKHSTLMLLSSIFILGLIFIIQGTNNPLLVSILHFLGKAGYLQIFAPLREWGKLSILIPPFLILMLITGLTFLKTKKVIIISTLLILTILNITYSPALIYIHQVYSPARIPQEYYNLSTKISPSYKTLWIYPTSANNILGTWRYIWNKDKAISTNLEWSIGSEHNRDFQFVKMLSQKEAPEKLLDSLNIKYIIKRTDILGATSFKPEYSYLKNKTIGYLTLQENNDTFSLIYVPEHLIISDLDGKLFYAISFLPVPSKIAIITELQNELIRRIRTVFYDFSSIWLYQNIKDNGIILKPFEYTYFGCPSEQWSKASTSDPLHAEWHPFLNNFGIENWQSDYGEGIVFTWKVLRIPEKVSPTHDDILIQWTFDNYQELLEWNKYTPEQQFGAIQQLRIEQKSLKATLMNSTWGWKTINSPLLPANYRNAYRFEFQIKAENIYKLHATIAEYNAQKELINVHYVRYIGSGSFDWQTITIDYRPENPETKYIQLQIWHGHETTQPLPNIIWIDNVKIYDLKRFTEPVTLEIPFTLQETNQYIFLTRLFQNQKGGKIQIQLDNHNYTLNTKDQLNKFTWKQIDTLQLEKGNHKITLTNLEGFNAINLFALIPKQEYQNAQKQLEQTLQNKRIIYILEAETDLYHQNTTTSNKYGGEASNGQTLELNQTSKAWNTIEIIKPGNYTLAIRSQGNLTIKIDKKEYKINTTQLDWTYIGPIYLKKGSHTIEITNPIQQPQPSQLDVIWLYYTQNKNENLKDIFKCNQPPAKIIKYQKINPTKYEIEVNATKPFMLSFAESYDPLWVAYVNGEKIHSIPLYGVINGFYVNQTGYLEITIEYEPQRWFNLGCIISLTTLLACLTTLTITHIKQKHKQYQKE